MTTSSSFSCMLTTTAAVIVLLTLFATNSHTVDAAASSTEYIMSIHTISPDSVNQWKWLRRLIGQEEMIKESQGFNRGRIQELQYRSRSLGAGLAVIIIACLALWAATAFAVWRLYQLRQGSPQPTSVASYPPKIITSGMSPFPPTQMITQKVPMGGMMPMPVGSSPTRIIGGSPVRLAGGSPVRMGQPFLG